MNRRGDLSIRAAMQNNQPAEFRSKLIESGFFSNVVLDEQTPTPDRQRVTVRMSAQCKPPGSRPTVKVEPIPANSFRPGGPEGMMIMPEGFGPPGMPMPMGPGSFPPPGLQELRPRRGGPPPNTDPGMPAIPIAPAGAPFQGAAFESDGGGSAFSATKPSFRFPDAGEIVLRPTLTRPAGTLSHRMGEGWGEGILFGIRSVSGLPQNRALGSGSLSLAVGSADERPNREAMDL